MATHQSILIVGANRGIGLELVKQLLAHGHTVCGQIPNGLKRCTSQLAWLDNWDTHRQQLAATGSKTLEVDFADETSIRSAAKEFEMQQLDILINCAGAYNLWDDKDFTEMEADDLIWSFKVNVVGPFLTSKHFLPILMKSKPGKIINISSDMASIGGNTTGGNACYRISKSGLNQLTKTMSLDLQKLAPNVLTLAIHPGWVATKMTGYYGEDDMDECTKGLVSIIERFGIDGEEDTFENGGYIRWNGQKMDY